MTDEIRILYVDDEPALLELARTYLEMSGEFRVWISPSAEEALDTPLNRSYDVIVSDYQMPGMDGIAFLKAVRERFGNLPFILFTGRGREEVVIDAINNGADFYLQKGGNPRAQFAELTHKIRQAVARQRVQAELKEAYDRIIQSEEELARSEQQIQESDRKFRDFADHLPQMVFETDLDLNITYVNQYTIETYGFPPERLGRSTSVLSLIHPSQHSTFMESVHNIVNQIPFEPKEYTAFNSEGKPFPVVVYSSPIYRNNQLVGFRGVAMDISERKRAEEALFNSRQMLQTVLDTIPQRVFWKDRDLVFLGCNKHLAHDIGYCDPSALIGKTDYDHSSASIAENFRADDREVMESGQPKINYEEPQIRPDGSVSWLRTSKVPLRNKEGAIIGVLGTYEDITESRKAQEALAESEAKFRDLTDRLPQMVFESNRDLRITYANRHAVSVFHFTEEELGSGIPVISLIDPAEHATFMKGVQNILDNIPFEPKEYTGIKRDGSTFPAIIYSSPIYKNKEICGFRGVVVDISGWKKLEDGIRESEEKFRSLVENANDIVFSLNTSGNFTYISPQWKDILGHDPATLIGTPGGALIHPEDRPQNIAAFRQAMTTGTKIHGLEYRIQHKDGTWRWHSQSAAPQRNGSGTIVAYQGICHDITERKRVLEALRQASKKLGLLSGITRHDINNQLMMLGGYVELLRKKIPNPAFEKDFSRIEATSRHITHLIQFTKEYEEVGVHAPLWQNVRTLADTAWRDVVPGRVTCKNDLPAGLEVFADPLIAKVFFNLADNALRYGETITTIRFSSREKDGEQIIVCEDDGNGVAAHDKEKIFHPGFGKNTGFGLAISREILDISGITITENGKPGKGARFEITVPAGQFRSAP
jgi:PAS domain S-box-containing protein